MISDDELWQKCIKGEEILPEDLGISPILSNCHTIIECGFKTFYKDDNNYYDVYGNHVSLKDIKKYGLY